MHNKQLVYYLKLCFIPEIDQWGWDASFSQAEQALKGGATAIQLRAYHQNDKDLYHFGLKLKSLTQSHHALFVINNRIDIALALQADGIHLGQQDLPLSKAKKIIPFSMKVGVSVENLIQATEAEKDGADYISVQSIFQSPSKEVQVVGLSTLEQICNERNIPVIGIGGITINNASHVICTGAKGIACISAISKSNDPMFSAKQLIETVNHEIELFYSKEKKK